MKDKLILLVDADADCAGIVLEAGARTGHGVRLSQDSREALVVLRRECDHIDSIVLDLDPGADGLALIEALSTVRPGPPVLVLTELEKGDRELVVTRHGAAACLGKPVALDRLKAAIEHSTRNQCDHDVSCDPWGHPRRACQARGGQHLCLSTKGATSGQRFP